MEIQDIATDTASTCVGLETKVTGMQIFDSNHDSTTSSWAIIMKNSVVSWDGFIIKYSVRQPCFCDTEDSVIR